MSRAVAALDPRTLSRLIVPPLDAEPWPTVGPELCDWIEEFLVHGPGDILGRPAELLDEQRLFIYRAYEVFPRGHEFEGRRRFKRAVLSRRKGFAKTELAAWLAIAEMDPTAPVRCDGFHVEAGEWVPVGRPITDPYIPMVATTEEQSEDLAYGAARVILENCVLGNVYDIGIERIMHRDFPGEMKALASAPSARDGARTTFQHFDETHLFVSDRLRGAHTTMLRNTPKRKASDAWSLETSTMYAPGEESVAEASHAYALAVLAGDLDEPTLLFDHRQASELHDLETKSGLDAAIEEASGDAFAYADVQAIRAQYRDPNGDKNEFRRYWLNQRRRSSKRWLAEGVWDDLVDEDRPLPEDGEPVVLSFDGSYSRDSTALLGCTVEAPLDVQVEVDEWGNRTVTIPEGAVKPHVFVVAAWERPAGDPLWRTPRLEVEAEVDAAMARWEVLELSPDPPGWHREVEQWEDTYGDTVVRFETNQPSRMGPACDEFEQAAKDRLFTHDGNQRLAVHVANCSTRKRGRWVLIDKPGGQDSPDKIDLAVGAVIAYHRAMWHSHNRSRPTPFAFA